VFRFLAEIVFLGGLMKPMKDEQIQMCLFKEVLSEMLNPKHPLYLLGERIPWEIFEKEFKDLYGNTGRPAKPVRLMTALLILKQLYELSDESVIQAWVENPYYQHFSGMRTFQWKFPIDPTDLVYFRKRIGEKGVEKILEVSICMHGEKAKEKEAVIDSTVQEKNITFPTDTNLYRGIIEGCLRIAKDEGLILRQSYTRTTKALLLDQRFRNHPKNYRKALKSQKRLRTIAGRLVREIGRKTSEYSEILELYVKVLSKKKNDNNKVYSLHEPQVYCIAKGKENKKYEFGSKASIAVTKNSGIIVGAFNIRENTHDSKTLSSTLSQVEALTKAKPSFAICDRGYRGVSEINGTKILIPSRSKKTATLYEKRKARLRFRRRGAIEPLIGHLKSDYRLARNYLKGHMGDGVNLMLAATAFNFSKLMKELASFLFSILWFVFFSKNTTRHQLLAPP
jgi:transposase, IS5 family